MTSADPPNTGDEGWTGTEQAARALTRSPRTIRRYIDSGELEARKQRNGRVEEWEVSISSLQALRDRLIAAGKLRAEAAGIKEGDGQEEVILGDPAEAARLSDVMERIVSRAEALSREVGDLRARYEITAKAESTLREELADLEERRRGAERRAEEAETQAEQERAERERLEAELETERAKGFWRRLFG